MKSERSLKTKMEIRKKSVDMKKKVKREGNKSKNENKGEKV